jgi:dihydrofolate synthase/folylpolyglutamate synthase
LAELAKARGADLWLDGGHNPHAGVALAEAAGVLMARDPRPLVLIAAMFARKDAKGFFAPFTALDPKVIATTFESDSAATASEIDAAARAAGLQSELALNVTEALERALGSDGPAPHVLICGGLHFAGEVLAMSQETWPD